MIWWHVTIVVCGCTVPVLALTVFRMSQILCGGIAIVRSVMLCHDPSIRLSLLQTVLNHSNYNEYTDLILVIL